MRAWSCSTFYFRSCCTSVCSVQPSGLGYRRSILHRHLLYYTCTPVCTTPILAIIYLYTCLYCTDTTLLHRSVLHRYLLYYTCTPVSNTPMPIHQFYTTPLHKSVLHQYLMYCTCTLVCITPVTCVTDSAQTGTG